MFWDWSIWMNLVENLLLMVFLWFFAAYYNSSGFVLIQFQFVLNKSSINLILFISGQSKLLREIYIFAINHQKFYVDNIYDVLMDNEIFSSHSLQLLLQFYSRDLQLHLIIFSTNLEIASSFARRVLFVSTNCFMIY